MSKTEFPRKICDKKDDPECSFAYRGFGMTCQTCSRYVHPGDPYAKELFQYYKEELAEEVPEPAKKENLTFHSILNAHSAYLDADRELSRLLNQQEYPIIFEVATPKEWQELKESIKSQKEILEQAKQEMDRLQVLFEKRS